MAEWGYAESSPQQGVMPGARRDAVSAKTITLALVLSASTYAALLCALLTLGAPINNLAVAATDAAIVLSALALALRAATWPVALLIAGIVGQFCLQRALAPELDFKPIRDLLAIVAFFFVGRAYGDPAAVRRAFFILSLLVVALGAWEYLSVETYTAVFNVRQYYIARGMADANAIGSGDLFASGVRAFDRVLLGFLGQHRVSSVFLEPVSMGNFGAIAIALGLAEDRLRSRWALFAIAVGALAIVFADARFALGATIAFALARFLPFSWMRPLTLVMPFVILCGVLLIGASAPGGGDTLFTRLGASGDAVARMSLQEVFGFAPSGGYATQDSGYYYVLKSFGIVLLASLWMAFTFLKTPTSRAARFKLYVAIYICLLLCISSASLFALKTSALLWFSLGAFSSFTSDPKRSLQ